MPGQIGRANVLAAIAHDAGEAVEKLRFVQVLQRAGAELFDGLVFKIERGEGAEGLPPRPGHEIQRGHEEVGVFALREIGQEEQDAAQRDPPEEVAQDGEGVGVQPAP